jgi:hypothetical protein
VFSFWLAYSLGNLSTVGLVVGSKMR